MKIEGLFSFNNGGDVVSAHPLWADVKCVIGLVEAESCRTKSSKEQNQVDKLLYSPIDLNNCFKKLFEERGWEKSRIYAEHSTEFYVNHARGKVPDGFREIDFAKDKVGIEVQFGKYAFMVYDICSKMPIFAKRGLISCGIEIVPMKSLAQEMSSGVSYFEQVVWDLENRGPSNIDIPVFIVGVAA